MSLDKTSESTKTISGNTNCECPDNGGVKGAALIIGIAGGTGSGKTTVARKLKESYPPHLVQVIAQDSYYKDQSDIPLEDRPKTNYDHPDAYDNDLLIQTFGWLQNTCFASNEWLQYPVHIPQELLYPSLWLSCEQKSHIPHSKSR